MEYALLIQSLRNLFNAAAKKTRYLRWLMLGFWIFAGLIFTLLITAGILIVTGNEESLPYACIIAGSREDTISTVLLCGLALPFVALPLLGHAIVWRDRTLRAVYYLAQELEDSHNLVLLTAITAHSTWFIKDCCAVDLHSRMESIGVKAKSYSELFDWLAARGLKKEYFRATGQ